MDLRAPQAARFKKQTADLTRALATELIRTWLGSAATCHSVEPLSGGICSPVYALNFDEPPHTAVVKLRALEDDPLPRERLCLDYLRQHTNVPCPEVYCQDDSCSVLPYSFLLLQRLPGINLQDAELTAVQRRPLEIELADAVLELHSHKRETFGDFKDDSGSPSWGDVFLPDLHEIRQDVEEILPARTLRALDRALSSVEGAFLEQGQAALVHNDLWNGNIMVEQRQGSWHLSGFIDPGGLRFADAESELAYLQVFDTVGQSFMNRYAAVRPLREGYERRKLYYWMHTQMVHLWLGFRGNLASDLLRTAQQITAGSA